MHVDTARARAHTHTHTERDRERERERKKERKRERDLLNLHRTKQKRVGDYFDRCAMVIWSLISY